MICQLSRGRFSASCWGLAAVLAAAMALAERPACAQAPELGPEDRATLMRYARDTWRSLDAMVFPGGLPADGLEMSEDGSWKPTEMTTPTDLGAYLWSVLAAEKLVLITPDDARRRLRETLAAITRLDRPHGFVFDWVDGRTGATVRVSKRDGKPIKPMLSTVDNGWLAVGLMMVRNTHAELREKAEDLLGPMDFSFFYQPFDPADPIRNPGQLHGVYWPDDDSFGFLHGLLNTEPRIASYVGIARGQLPPEHYYRIQRTWPRGQGPQSQLPHGVVRTYEGVPVFEGHYTYRGMRIVPSWGGSMFEALMVTLFVPESQWAPRSWGVNHPLYVRAQIEHGLDEARYGFWGFSPACRPEGGYRTFGVDALGTSADGYTSNDSGARAGQGRSANAFAGGVVTPHAVFLALPFAPREAMSNLRALANKFPIYGPYGFRDSVNLSTGVVAHCMLSLDQGMIMAALANALTDNAMQHAFSDGDVERVLRPLIAPEEFTAGPAPDQPAHATHEPSR